MSILNVENCSKHLGDREILTQVNIGIEAGDRLGVLGINGQGKSTLLRLIAGKLEPDEGQVVMERGLRISHMEQSVAFDEEKNLLENVTALVQGKEAHWDTAGEVRSTLLGLGLPDPEAKVSTLSGGQKKRAALAAALLTPCDLLILDEPTNHLDIGMVEWLENRLQNFKGAVLLVTHDRYFLDAVVNGIIEIDRTRVYRYEGGYDEYLEKKQERFDMALAAERKQAALYRQDLAWMMRGARARSTKQKAHIRRFESLRDREKIVEERSVVLSSLSTRLGSKTIELKDVGMAFGGKTLFSGLTYLFTPTDRIGIIGPNGCGKTTLLKIILGEVKPLRGSVEIGQTVKFGYFGQENEALDPKERVIDVVRDRAEFVRTETGLVSASTMCERFLFDARMQYTPTEKLSGGEKRRLLLLRVLMDAPNVLVLDEPTNDLDIQTLQILEDYLDHFPGIVITASHDRYFLDRVTTRIFGFREGEEELFRSEGGYTEYVEHTQEPEEEKQAGRPKESPEKAKASREPAREHTKKKKLSYNEERELAGLEEEIDSLTDKSGALEEAIAEAATDFEKLSELTKEQEALEKLIEEKMERFLYLSEVKENLEAQS